MKKIILISFMLITTVAFASDLKDCSDNIKQSRAEEISAILLPTLAYTKNNEIQFKAFSLIRN